MNDFLSLPQAESRLRQNSKDLIREYINARSFEDFAAANGLPLAHVFVNMVPIITGAASEFIPHIKELLKPQSVEARHFADQFETVAQARFQEPEFIELASAVFG